MWTDSICMWVCVCMYWCTFAQHSHIAFRIMTVVESRFQSNTDVNANWIHECDILSHMKYVGRNKLIGFSYISFNGTSFISISFLLFLLNLVVFATCYTYKRGRYTHTQTLTWAWIFSERGTYGRVCVRVDVQCTVASFCVCVYVFHKVYCRVKTRATCM